MNTILRSYQNTNYFNTPFNHLKSVSNSNKTNKLKLFTNLLFSSHSTNTNNNTKINFEGIINQRKIQAKNSIIVQVNSEKSAPDLYAYCKSIGKIKEMHHYSLSQNNYILVEFSYENDIENILKTVTFYDGHIIPIKSQFLWFRAKGNKKKKNDYMDIPLRQIQSPPENFDFKEIFNQNKNISEQIISFYNLYKMNDLSLRLRFLTARQIEKALFGLFPLVNLTPFGSSINGFGNANCDLDLYINLYKDINLNTSQSRLVYQNRNTNANERAQIQQHMETFADIISNFLPGCRQIRKILHARVPIIKYKQEYTGLDCDLSLTSSASVHMSEILYIYKEIDNRVAPLVFIIRAWARYIGITNPNPGRWITNFSLTLLVIFYLQNSVKILPSLQFLKNLSAKEKKKNDGQLQWLFNQDLKKILINFTPGQKNLSLNELLIGFFQFYSTFSFEEYAISLKTGEPIRKPEECALYIVNPIEENLNVSRNVSVEEIERFKLEVREAAWNFQSESDDLSIIFKLRNFSKTINHVSLNISDIFENGQSPENNNLDKRKQVLIKD